MAGLIKSLLAPLRGKRASAPASPGFRDVSMATVRPAEANPYSQKYKQYQAAELVLRFVKHVKVAASRNAAAVAGTPLRVYRRGRGEKVGKGSVWRTREIKSLELDRLRVRAAPIAAKAASMDDGVEEIIDPAFPLVSLLRNANTRDNGYALIERLSMDCDLTGEHYWYMVLGGGLPVELWPFDAQFVRPIPHREKFIEGYIYGRGTEVEKFYPPESIIPFLVPNPRGDPYHGFGCLAACIGDADLSTAFTDLAYNMVQNGAQPGVIVSPKDAASGFTTEQSDAMEAKLTNRSGPAQACRSVVFNTPVEVKTIAFTDKEMAFLSSDDHVREAIANCFDMPVGLLTLDTSALATAAVAMQHWQKMAIAPRCRRIEDQINQRLVRMFLSPESEGRGEEIFVAFDEPVTEDMNAVSTRIVGEYGAGLVTQNEARTRLGYDAVDGGDDFKEDPALAALEMGGAFGGPDDPDSERRSDRGGDKRDRGGSHAKGGAGVGEREGTGAPAGPVPVPVLPCGCATKSGSCVSQLTALLRVQHPLWDEARLRRAAQRACSADEDDGGSSAPTGEGTVPASPGGGTRSMADVMFGRKTHGCCEFSRKDDRLSGGLTASERQLESALRAAFNTISGHILPQVSPAGLGMDLTANGEVAGILRDATTPTLTRMVLEGWQRGLADVGQRPGREVAAALTDAPAAYLRDHQNSLIRSVTSTLADRIRDELATGVQAGEAMGELTARVSSIMGDVAAYGSERIARTETARAYLESRQEAWRATGEVEGWTWQLSAAPCDVCIEAAEAIARLPGHKAGFGHPTPPAHPNCRCGTAAVFRENA